ncbi:TDP-N-acetylfucosamine:lipid II N-acetylfucosaminyltransferase [Shewanella cyperi]|uniref:TDP-N-acetylfucosamine:lipid II N-acetylfucosaminyltransferase n=1 Tax=Shewanella cyperi TaxID=2814292 RepID=UPI001A943F7E|nr:TDP-N-acetylfucosamine:lipid II N-acetylfucosaminyltransferase [Shewanella cyperi]QSX39646.1 TDP-N-acetylfucosamine:lipid II N-acetylfucosaminyltransferase [Shewanella cyperi]
MLKIAHIAADEKFIENAVDIFEIAFPNQNTFYINAPKPWRFVKDRVIYKNFSSKKWVEYFLLNRSEMKSYDLIILHSLPSTFLIPPVLLKQRYVWLGWGFDYYSRPFDKDLLPNPVVLEKTKKRYIGVNDNIGPSVKCLSVLKSLAKKIIESKTFYNLAMRNVKVFSPVLPQEFDLVKNFYGLGKETKYSPWNYGILERHLIKNIELNNIDSANSILLGNSATPTNNHFEALDIILHSDFMRTVYVPLSYGDMIYAKSVKEYIYNNPKLASQCKVLDTFLPLDEYNAIINNCGFVIMNHVRQQALGNIVAMLYRGSKVFLREESVLYKFFKGLSAHIYSVQELEINQDLLEHHLTSEQIQDNRTLLKNIWSELVVVDRTKKLVFAAIS